MIWKRQALWLASVCLSAAKYPVAAATRRVPAAFVTTSRTFATGTSSAHGISNGLAASQSQSQSQSQVSSGNAESKTPSAVECDDPRVVTQRVFATDKRPVILFDGVCNLCNGAVNLALDWDPKGKLRFSALQSNVGRSLLQANGRAADDISSIVLVTQDGAYIKSDAIMKITEALTPLSFLPLKPAAVVGRWIIPKFLRDLIYDGVADNRYNLLGKQDQCRFDADGEFEDRFIKDDLALARKE